MDEMDILTPFKASPSFDIVVLLGQGRDWQVNPQDNHFDFRSGIQVLLCKCVRFAWDKTSCQEPMQALDSEHLIRKGGYKRQNTTCCSQVSSWCRYPRTPGYGTIRRIPIMPLICFIYYTHMRTSIFLKGKTQISPTKPQITYALRKIPTEKQRSKRAWALWDFFFLFLTKVERH